MEEKEKKNDTEKRMKMTMKVKVHLFLGGNTNTHKSPHAKASVDTPNLTQECSFFVSHIARPWSFSKSEK